MIGFISASVTRSLNHTYYSAIADLHNLQFTVAHALGLSVSTSCLLATDLNTETSTSNHYEVFLPFLVQLPWNFGNSSKNSVYYSLLQLSACSSKLRLPANDLCCPLQTLRADLQKTYHVIPTQRVHWRADCCLATSYKYFCYGCVRASRGVYRAVA
jgi:hypothetical protein